MKPMGGADLPPPLRFAHAGHRFDLPSAFLGYPCLVSSLAFRFFVLSVEAQPHRAFSPGVCILFPSMHDGFRGAS